MKAAPHRKWGNNKGMKKMRRLKNNIYICVIIVDVAFFLLKKIVIYLL